MQKRGIAAFLCLAVCIGFTGCSLVKSDGNANPGENQSGSITVQDGMKEFTATDGTIKISVPKGFDQADAGALNAEANIELMDENKFRYCVCVTEKKEDFDTDFAGYVDLTGGMIQEAYATGEISEMKTAEVNGKSLQYMEIIYTAEGVKTYIQWIPVETEQHYVQVLIWSLKSSQSWVEKNGCAIAASVADTAAA